MLPRDQELYDLVTRAPHPKSLPCQVLRLWSCGKGDKTFLICHLTSCGHMIKAHITLSVGAPHPNYHCAKYGSGDITFLLSRDTP